jgi:hypothetical protein
MIKETVAKQFLLLDTVILLKFCQSNNQPNIYTDIPDSTLKSLYCDYNRRCDYAPTLEIALNRC